MGSRTRADSEGSYLASISDLMAGVLFLFIAIIVVFALNLRVAEDQHTGAEEELRQQAQGPKQARERLLKGLKTALLEAGVSVVIDSDHGVLRLPDDSVTFPQGTDQLTAQSKDKLTKLASILRNVLPCYSHTAHDIPSCPTHEASGMLDAVLVEGHTDRHRVIRLAGFRDNWDLSAARAIQTYHYLVAVAPELDSYLNSRGERLLSVSGYADSRPADSGSDADADRRNRRIDIRFIMAPPSPSLPPKAAAEQAVLSSP
jgi:flagellar motor protein MotB